MNERDSEILSQSLSQHDYIETMNIDSADLIILNTCSIRAKAEQKVMSLLGYLRKNKQRNPDLKICVAGCVAQQQGESLIERMPHVNLVIGTQHIYNIANLLKESEKISVVKTTLDKNYVIPSFIPDVQPVDSVVTDMVTQENEFSRFVTIMQGCNNYCTYCVVPYTRGREVSRKVKDIVEEVKVLVHSGVQEITLLGQNVNSYGMTNAVTDDGSPFAFNQLLREVSSISGLRRLRFTTSNPKDLSEDLMKCFVDLDNLCPQFHLPVQSGSNQILQRMNRKYTREKYLELVESLRRYCPEIALTTDIIVGFPGESTKDFMETMNLLETVRFHGSFSFKYSDRPGTASVKLNNKVSEEDKSERLAFFQKRQKEISLERNLEFLDKSLEVLVESCGEDSYKCRTKTNHVVHVDSTLPLTPGQLVNVKINHAGHHSLKGSALVGNRN